MSIIFSQNVIFAATSCPDVHLFATTFALSPSFITLVMAQSASGHFKQKFLNMYFTTCLFYFPSYSLLNQKWSGFCPTRPLHSSHQERKCCSFPRALSGHSLLSTLFPCFLWHLLPRSLASLLCPSLRVDVPQGSLRLASLPHPPLFRVIPFPAMTDGLTHSTPEP